MEGARIHLYPAWSAMSEEWKHNLISWLTIIGKLFAGTVAVILVSWSVLARNLDDRYAPASIQKHVDANAKVGIEVQRAVDDLRLQLKAVREDLGQEVVGIKAIFLRDRLFELRVKQCTAETSDARRYYAREIQEREDEYRRIAGESPPALPRCDDVK